MKVSLVQIDKVWISFIFGRTNPINKKTMKQQKPQENTMKPFKRCLKSNIVICNDVIKALNIVETPAQHILQCSRQMSLPASQRNWLALSACSISCIKYMLLFQMGQPDIVLFLECSADIMTQRLQQRATCSLHTKEARDRDTRSRVDGFCSLVNPVVSHYEDREVLHKVGMETPSYCTTSHSGDVSV